MWTLNVEVIKVFLSAWILFVYDTANPSCSIYIFIPHFSSLILLLLLNFKLQIVLCLRYLAAVSNVLLHTGQAQGSTPWWCLRWKINLSLRGELYPQWVHMCFTPLWLLMCNHNPDRRLYCFPHIPHWFLPSSWEGPATNEKKWKQMRWWCFEWEENRVEQLSL